MVSGVYLREKAENVLQQLRAKVQMQHSVANLFEENKIVIHRLPSIKPESIQKA